jgi:hypothetical protein
VKLVEEGDIGGLGEERLFVEEGEDTHGLLLNEVDGGLEIQSKVNESPFNSFTSIFLLFEGEHVVIEELLKSFVGIVNAQLFERVNLEDFESRNI